MKGNKLDLYYKSPWTEDRWTIEQYNSQWYSHISSRHLNPGNCSPATSADAKDSVKLKETINLHLGLELTQNRKNQGQNVTKETTAIKINKK